MAKPPAPSAAPMPDDTTAPTDDEDMGAPADDTGTDDGDESGDVLLTVLKESDGTYKLIQGDEEDAGEGTEGAAGGEQGQTFDSVGALLKGILDVLREDQSSAGAEGSSEDQFQSGFGEAGKPATPMVQKY